MTESVTTATPEITTANSSPEVSTPHVSPKPYDDDMLALYQEESKGEEVSETETEVTSVAKETTTDKPEEVAKEAKEDAETPKAKEGDTVDDGFENVPVKKLINGKEVEFKVKDAIQAYVKQEEFNRTMDKRLSEVSRREKVWNDDQGQFRDVIGKLIDTAQKGDFVTAIRGLAKIAFDGTGSDVTEFEKSYFEQLDKVRDVYTKMSPEQREAYFAKRKAAEAEERANKLEEAQASQIATAQLQEQVATLQKQHGLSEEEFWGSFRALQENLVGEGKVFKDDSEITADKVVEYTLRLRHESKVVEAAKKAEEVPEEVLDEVSRLTFEQPDITVDDIVTVIKASGLAKAADPQAVENLNRKAGAARLRSSPQASSTKKENLDGYDPESIEFLYRKQPPVYRRPQR